MLEEIEWTDEDGTDGLATVYPPYCDPDLKIDWADTIPDFIKEAGHGTTFTLLGRNPTDNTIDGDPERERIAPLPRPQVLQHALLGSARRRDAAGLRDAARTRRTGRRPDSGPVPHGARR